MSTMFRPGRTAALFAALVALTAPLLARAQSLNIGDPAPALTVSKWVKGKEVSTFEKGKLYVVEFWATWCGPCKTSIPHLTEMQKANPDVKFIGVSVWEQDQKLVAPFVEKMADKMAYTVAMDSVPEGGKGNDGAMAAHWMTAAGQNGIPAAFVVDKEGKIAWIGHPMGGLDKVIEQVKAGTFDVKAEAEKMKAEAAQEAAMQATMQEIQAAAKRSPKEGIAAIDKAIAEKPELKPQLVGIRYDLLLASDEKAAYAYGRELMNGDWKNNPMGLNGLAWVIVDNKGKLKTPDYDLALAAAERANTLTKGEDAAVLDTLAYTQYKKGDKKKALANQTKAVALLKAKNVPADERKDYEDHLALYMK